MSQANPSHRPTVSQLLPFPDFPKRKEHSLIYQDTAPTKQSNSSSPTSRPDGLTYIVSAHKVRNKLGALPQVTMGGVS